MELKKNPPQRSGVQVYRSIKSKYLKLYLGTQVNLLSKSPLLQMVLVKYAYNEKHEISLSNPTQRRVSFVTLKFTHFGSGQKQLNGNTQK